jgi:EmrB/QacA subfamily drug resistance transporter
MTEAANPVRWKALSVIAIVQFMLVLDVTVVNVALPHIQTDLRFSSSGLAWVVDGYVLTAGGLILLGGRLGDLLGRKRLFIIGVLLFSLASAVCGAATDPAMLVTSRFVQGAGEALASPAAFGLVALLFTEPKERAKAIGVFGGTAGLGGTLGPILSGLLISVASWRWIFYINVPVGIVCTLAVARMVNESRAERPAHKPSPDFAGALLGTGGIVALVYAFISAGTHPWGSTQVVVSLVISTVALVAFVVRERTASNPLVPASAVANRTRLSANIGNVFFASVFFTMFFLLTLYLQEVQHYSAIRTGFAYLPFGLVIGGGIAIASGLVTRVGIKPLLCTGAAFMAGGLLLLSRITAGGSYDGEVLPALCVTAFGAGLSFAAFGNASMHGVTDQDASVAAGVSSTSQQIGGAVGLAVLATVALRHAASSAAHGVDYRVASTAGDSLAFRLSALVALAGGVVVALSPIATATLAAAPGRKETDLEVTDLAGP